jgi:DNA polymerase III delta subunit
VSRAPVARVTPRGTGAGISALIARWEGGKFPASIYLEGPSEAIKNAVLGEFKRAWAALRPGGTPHVFRVAESGIDEILAAYQNTSLFGGSELVIVLEIEDLGRSEKKIAGLARGVASGGGDSCLALVESAAETPRKALEPLRGACDEHVITASLTRPELKTWGERSLARAGARADGRAVEAIVDACEGDPLVFFNELEKLAAWAGDGGTLTATDVTALLRPAVGADLPEYLGAIALGRPALAAQRLGRLLAAGVGEGSVLFALSNLVGGAMGGWARWRALSEAYRRRVSPRDLDRALDAVYRAEAAWKSGRADVVALLEQTTRTLSGLA